MTPAAHVDSPDTRYRPLHVGWHDSPVSNALVQLPTPHPVVLRVIGALVTWLRGHPNGAHVAGVSIPFWQRVTLVPGISLYPGLHPGMHDVGTASAFA